MRKVYLDNAATTRPHPKVVEAMQPYFTELFGNPLSFHSYGQAAKKAVDEAREKVAKLINAKPSEIIFTSTGTEANNFAIKSAATANQQKGKHIVISGIEHHSVLYSAKAMEKLGFKVTLLPVDKYGIVNPEDVLKAITPETILVSVMHSNNEIGTIEPISEISKITKEKGILLHTDAAMSVGNIPVDAAGLGVDMLTMSAHKFYGPKGIGALYVRKGARIVPFIHGGIQEDGRRAGADNVQGIVGMGMAAEIAMEEIPERVKKITPLRDKLIKGLTEKIEHIHVNGHLTNRLPGNVNICIDYIEGEAMLLFLIKEGIAASSGSTCSSKALKASHVLLAIGVSDATAQGSLLFSLGRDTTQEDIDHVLTVLPPIVERLRAMSPIYNK
ncbi:MAG: cysteine desulfurase NifS [Nitrospirae bacterium RBG_19FT_COMBO_42_15]|nr:MAG: cysteine desulfurase NifS [Nitrospirae bacterium RBG_19FT_COMBO_42_15]